MGQGRVWVRGWGALVGGVLDDFADVDVGCRRVAVAGGKVQNTFAADVGWEPIAAVNLLAQGHEGWMEIFLAFFGVVGDHAAVGDDDLKIVVVYPDSAEQAAMVFVDLPGADVEDIALNLVDLLLADVGDFVGGKVGGGEDKKVAVLQVLEIGRGEHDAPEGALRCVHRSFNAAAVGRQELIVDLVEFAIGGMPCVVDGLDADLAAPGVVIEGCLKLGFPCGEPLDDFFGRDDGRGGVHGTEALVERHGGEGVLVLGRRGARCGQCECGKKKADRPNCSD